ncbi:MAG: hypothetical protein WD066_18370 [Planctomycetaceae bacterium]
MTKKAKRKGPFHGRWRITWTDQWDEDELDEEQDSFDVETNGIGSFRLVSIEGEIDYRTTVRDGHPAIEFSWEGGDEADGTPLTGRGWAVLEGEELRGAVFVHHGDDWQFKAAR